MIDIAFVPIVKRNGNYQKLLSANISITPKAKGKGQRAKGKGQKAKGIVNS